jgi:hypothetical protein
MTAAPERMIMVLVTERRWDESDPQSESEYAKSIVGAIDGIQRQLMGDDWGNRGVLTTGRSFCGVRCQYTSPSSHVSLKRATKTFLAAW